MTISCMQCGVRLEAASANLRCPRCGSARDGFSRLSMRAPLGGAGEGSGLIDLRMMQAGLGGRELAVPVLGGLTPAAAVSPVAPQRPTTRSHAQLPASQLPLYSLIVALTLGLATLSTYVLTRPSAPPPVRVELPAIVAAAPIVEAAAKEVEPEPVVEPAVEEEPVKEAPVEVVKPVKPGTKSVVKVKPTPEVVKETPSEVVKAKPPVEPDDSVDCLLGRKQCGGKSPEPEVPVVAVAPAGSELPAMLEQSDISALTSAGRAAAADACGAMTRGGERVKLRVSIAGPSGSITGTTVVDDAGNPQLATCAAQEVGRLAVKKVQKPQIGAMLTLKF